MVDCSYGLAGTMAAGVLADYGADVVKIEAVDADSVAVFDRGKRRVGIDVRQQEGIRSVLDLAADADVFLESWRPGVAHKLGLGAEVLREVAPALVYCSISGYGQHDTDRERPGYESLVAARLGVMAAQQGHRPGPIYTVQRLATQGAAHLAVVGIMAALYRREATGRGDHVDVSLLDGALAQMTLLWQFTERVTNANRLEPTLRLIAGSFLCADGQWLGIHTGAVGAHGRLMNAVGLNDRVSPAKGPVEMAERLTAEEGAAVATELPRMVATRSRDEWIETLLAADVCAIPLLRPGEVFTDRQVRHNQVIVEVDDPQHGKVLQVGPPVKFAAAPDEVRRAAPKGAIPSAHDVVRAPYEGLKVLDFGQYFAGPYASRFLADLGADVIKLEPVTGDPNRPLPRVFAGAQRGKRSMAVDLKSAAGREIALRLVAWADVVTHNMRPGAAERIGLGYEQVRVVQPDVIYVACPGWGSTGPDAARQGFAPLYSGMAGIHFLVAGEGNAPLWPVANEDYANGLVVAGAIGMALRCRARTGRGQYLESPQLNATLTMVNELMVTHDGTVLGLQPLDRGQYGRGALDRLYPTADGWICVVTRTQAHFEALCRALGAERLAGDPRFATSEARRAHDTELAVAIADRTTQRTSDALFDALDEAGVPCELPAPPDEGRHFLFDDDQVRAGRVTVYQHPEWGETRDIAQLIRFADTPLERGTPAPLLGQHTVEILVELGYDRTIIDDLRTAGVVAAR